MLHRAPDGRGLPTVSYTQLCFQGSFTNEYFQYVDHPQGKWVRAQEKIAIVKNGSAKSRRAGDSSTDPADIR